MGTKKAFRHLVEHVMRLGIANAAKVLYLKKLSKGREGVLRTPELAGPLIVRTGTSDLAIFDEVVMLRGYGFTLDPAPATIVDAGANIGLASSWFKRKYPHARIVAVEPDERNFDLLVRNTQHLKDITAVKAAIAAEDGHLTLERDGLRASSYRTRKGTAQENTIRAISMPTLMREYDLPRIGLLKLDIEGAEKELFEGRDLSWLDQVDTIAIELHDRMVPGCGHAFFKAMCDRPRNYEVHGQLVVASRMG